MALSITRKAGQTIVIHDEDSGAITTITLGEVRRNQVRLNFDGPQSVRILRGELKAKSKEPT